MSSANRPGTASRAASTETPFSRCHSSFMTYEIDSPSMRDRLGSQADPGRAKEEMAARVPLGRMGTAEEVAELIAYLAGARFTTGQIHVIDGGMVG